MVPVRRAPGCADRSRERQIGFRQVFEKFNIVVSASNGKTLQANIDLLKAQLNPLIETHFSFFFLSPKDKEHEAIATREDPVAWKQDLDDEVQRLNAAAKVRGVAIPPNFYYGFSPLPQPKPQ